MAVLLSPWLVVDGSTAPLPGLTPTFLYYGTVGGVSRTPPSIIDRGGGDYGFSPSDADVGAGVVWVVDNGSTATPRRMAGACYLIGSPIGMAFLEDASGALWTGAAPTIGRYVNAAGSTRTPPTVTNVASLGYLFAFVPTSADLAAGTSARIDGPAGSSITYSLEGPWDVQGDGAAPTATLVSPPTSSPLGTSTPVVVDVADNTLLASVMLVARFPARGIEEVVHNGTSFAALYSGASSRLAIAGGWRYTVLRNGGWFDSPTLDVYAVDSGGLVL